MISEDSHVVFVQYGDYREAFERFAAGGPEVYAAQRYSVDFVGKLAQERRVTVIALPPAPYDEKLQNGVRAIGMGWAERRDVLGLLKTLEQLRPTHLVVNTPLIAALLWGLLRAKRVLPNFADSFSSTSFRGRLTEKLLGRILNLPKFEVVSNHNFPAARNLVRIGVNPGKVLAWDWPSHARPEANSPKEAPDAALGFSLFYVGTILESKGVGDLIDAVALLRARAMPVRVSLAGNGVVDEMKQRAQSLGIAAHVDFIGRVSNDEVQRLMRAHDAVVVPSRSSYAEGLPMAIYEGLCSRSPLIVSNHPMFVPALGQQDGVLMFEEGKPESLAQAIVSLQDPAVYRRVSKCSAAAWESIQVPLKSGELLTRWIAGSDADVAALKTYSLQQLGRVS
jgi:glycosyltransferase involved in cell wall biosynthesis